MDVNVLCEYLVDFAMMFAGLFGMMYIYGEQRYQEGIQKGMRAQRRIDRAIRRGEIYRLK